MSYDNVIPFRKRPPSEGELEAYRRLTRSWSPQLRQMMFPEYFRHDQKKPDVRVE
jgi:hypothetical protein